jgi:hypothetical protein
MTKYEVANWLPGLTQISPDASNAWLPEAGSLSSQENRHSYFDLSCSTLLCCTHLILI